MKYVTGFFYGAGTCGSLVLQQVTRRRGKLPGVFAFVSENAHASKEMTEWFYERVLPCCARKNASDCVDEIQELFGAKMQEVSGGFVALFAVDSECFYAWKDNSEMWLLNRLFDRPHKRKLTWMTDAICVERVKLEAGIVLLLGNKESFGNLSEKWFQEFPEMGYFQSNGQADRYLRELVAVSEIQQNNESAFILIGIK